MNKKFNLRIMAVFGGGGPFWDDGFGTTLESHFPMTPELQALEDRFFIWSDKYT